jgi:hypothetical protein
MEGKMKFSRNGLAYFSLRWLHLDIELCFAECCRRWRLSFSRYTDLEDDALAWSLHAPFLMVVWWR